MLAPPRSPLTATQGFIKEWGHINFSSALGLVPVRSEAVAVLAL